MEVYPVVSIGLDCKSSIFGFGWCNSINFHSSISEENLQRKKEFHIKPITKNEANVLRQNNYGHFVICGHGTYRNYLVVEDRHVLKFLRDYRESIKIK